MNTYKNSIFSDFDKDLWSYLSSVSKPILIYGMGNGADKIISELEKHNIVYSDVFASDGFVRGHSYKGKRVLSYSEAIELYGNDIIILLSFGSSLPEVMERIYELDKKHELYAPDVPVCGGKVFNEEFFDANSEKLFSARALLSDEKSKNVFDDIIRYKLTGRLSFLKATEVTEDEALSLLNLNDYESYFDLGAYNGDTIRKFLDACPNLNKIYAFEPDKRNFKKLSSYCDTEERVNIKAFNYASYSKNEPLAFSSSGNRNSSYKATASYESKTTEIEGRRPDSITTDVDFIKYDVEGAEYDAIVGSEEIIKASRPDMIVSMYHKSEDLFELPLLINSIEPRYKLFLRRLPYIPAWDLNLYVKIK